MATIAEWIEGARPRTLPLSISPVIAGSAIALVGGAFMPWRALLALVVGVAMQLGVNLSNDYSDGVRGTDAHRVGPQRLVGSGAATPRAVKLAAFSCFGVGCAAGLALVIMSDLWWIIAVGAAIVIAAWFYTGGKHPYGYMGLGEVSVLIFFGLVAAAGTVVVQTGFGPAFHWPAVLMLCLAQGFGACAVLVVNNLRDIPSDTKAGKLTLSVRLGDGRSRVLFIALTVASLAASIATTLLTNPWLWLCLAMVPFLVMADAPVLKGVTGFGLIPSIKLVGFGQLAGAIGMFAGALIAIL